MNLFVLQRLEGIQRTENGPDCPFLNTTWIFTVTRKPICKVKIHFPIVYFSKKCVFFLEIFYTEHFQVFPLYLKSWNPEDNTQGKNIQKHSTMAK